MQTLDANTQGIKQHEDIPFWGFQKVGKELESKIQHQQNFALALLHEIR